MSRLTRIVIAVSLAVVILGLAFTIAVGAAIYTAGTVAVSVVEKQGDRTSIHLQIPAALIHVAVMFVPERKWRELRAQAGPELVRYWPLVEAAMSGLRQSPDGLLVGVDGPGETVSITKRGDVLIVDVDSPDATVHVTMPLGAVTSVARHLAPRREV